MLFGVWRKFIFSSCSTVECKQQIDLKFVFDICMMDPLKCVITRKLIPTQMRDYDRFIQAIWFHNIFSQDLFMSFSSTERGLSIVNPYFYLPKNSTVPLFVQYRPSDFQNELEIYLTFEGVTSKFFVYADGILEDKRTLDKCPIKDEPCADQPFSIYPNSIYFELHPLEEATKMIAFHNHSDKCVEFRLNSYYLLELLEIKFLPDIFRIKPKQSKLCVIKVNVEYKKFIFERIPITCEVHQVFCKATNVAKQLLEEIESIDDQKLLKESLIERIFLSVNIKAIGRAPIEIVVPKETELSVKLMNPLDMEIFERLFYDYLFNGDFARHSKKWEAQEELTYEEVVANVPIQTEKEFDKTVAKNILSRLTADAIRELAKHWRFVPLEMAYN